MYPTENHSYGAEATKKVEMTRMEESLGGLARDVSNLRSQIQMLENALSPVSKPKVKEESDNEKSSELPSFHVTSFINNSSHEIRKLSDKVNNIIGGLEI